MNSIVRVFIEIERHSNKKYEVDKETNQLVLDRILPYPYFYPYAYGFIPNTLAPDGDALDILLITEKEIPRGQTYSVSIIGVLHMEDEHGQDDKILCVLEEDHHIIQSIEDLPAQCLYDIQWFFSNYKSGQKGKWSFVYGYKGKNEAMQVYNQYSIQVSTSP
jgi:inorganic pyrophosphatase